MPLVSNRYLDSLQQRRVLSPVPSALPARADLLEPSDRLLLSLMFEKNLTLRQIAREVQMVPGSVCRRLQNIHARLRDPISIALCDNRCPLPEGFRELGLDHFLRGLPSREIARRRDLSRSRVREILVALRSWYRGLCAHRMFDKGT